MSDVAIRVEGLGKQYRLGGARESYSTIRDQFRKLTSLRGLLRRANHTEHRPPFWALKDVSFEVKQGEVVGIIGRNGAGKSTLLKILSRITEPTEGGVDIIGRVGSLLEVGTGFHPELTGRENVYLNGAIMGMKRTEIAQKFDEIVAFAEIEKFIDTPVKHYSSGMYMRLAFAVAAHLEPEILIVDEVLAVGDAEFQKKCLGKMGEVAVSGRTVLFVSHNLHAITSLCLRGLVFQGGRVAFEGSASACVTKYLTLGRGVTGSSDEFRSTTRSGTGEWQVTEVTPTKLILDPDEPKEFIFRLTPTRPYVDSVYLSGLLINDQGTTITQFDSRLINVWILDSRPVSGRLRIHGLWLKPGNYTIDFYVCSHSSIVDRLESAAEFEVSPILPYSQSTSSDAIASALVLTNFTWRIDI